MSTHAIPNASGDGDDSIRWQRYEDIKTLCRVYLRLPSGVTDSAGVLSLVFTPDLTAPQVTILNRIIVLSGLFRITPTEWAAIEADITTAKAFLAIATPTLVQTAAAQKSTIRILAAILRS